MIHEFGHVIQFTGFDDALEKRLTESYEAAKAKGIWNDVRAAQRFRRVKGGHPADLLDALVKAFPNQSPALLRSFEYWTPYWQRLREKHPKTGN